MALQNKHLNQKIEALPPEMQQEVVDFVEFLAFKHSKTQVQTSETERQDKTEQVQESANGTGISAYDLAEKLGLIGSMEGPGDLSTNKAYFEDFGK